MGTTPGFLGLAGGRDVFLDEDFPGKRHFLILGILVRAGFRLVGTEPVWGVYGG